MTTGHGGHGHHDHSHDLRGASKRSLVMALALISTYMVAADRAASAERTFGYQRTEVLAALANTVALWVIAGWILLEAYHRAFSETVEVDGLPVLIVGIDGLIINILAVKVLHSSSEHSMNVEGAMQHVIADMLGSMAVVIAAILILAFDRPNSADAFLGIDWTLPDPVLSVVIAFLIVYDSRHLIKSVMVVLLEGVPEHIDVYKLCSDIEDLEGVTVIHDVHVWTITSGSEAFTAHLIVDPLYTDTDLLLERIKELVHNSFGISHVTVQLELSGASCSNENHHVEHLLAEVRPVR